MKKIFYALVVATSVLILVACSHNPFTGIEDVTIGMGDTFEPMAGVSAKSKDGEDVSADVVITGEVDTKTPGEYVLTYSVLGVDKNRTVTVSERASATIQGATDTTVVQGGVFDRNEGVTATDFDGSNITASMTISGIVNTNTVSTYTLTYKVTGKNGVEVSVSRKIEVLGNARITGIENLPNSVLVDTVVDPLEGISALDNDGADVTDAIVLSGNLTDDLKVDTSTKGTKTVVYKITGKNQNEMTYTYELLVFEPEDATITFRGAAEDKPQTIKMSVGTVLDLLNVAIATDYDLAVLTPIISWDESIDDLVNAEVFAPSQMGTFEFTFKVTGKNGNEVVTVLTVEVIQMGIEIGGNFIPLSQDYVDFDGKPSDAAIIYTELKGIGEYGVVVIVDAHGYIVFVRDAYGTQYDYTNPIKVGVESNERSVANNDGWTGANVLKDLLGVQGTPGGIPEGGFAIFFNMNRLGAPHTARALGMAFAREIGLKVNIINLEIPNFNPELAADDLYFEGVEDIEIFSNEADTFDPMAGVVAKNPDGSSVTVEIIHNNIDFTKPINPEATAHTHAQYADGYYSIIYKATGANGYTRHVTRRVAVVAEPADATIEGVSNQEIALNTPFDPEAGVTAFDYDGSNLTDSLVVEGTVDIETAGTYTVTFKVTGKNGVLVEQTMTVIVLEVARLFLENNYVDTAYQGLPFDPFVGVKALDVDGTDISSQITLTSEIYIDDVFITDELGTFTLVYTVKGSNNIEVILETNVEVIEVPNATAHFNDGFTDEIIISLTDTLDLSKILNFKDFDDVVLELTIETDAETEALVVDNIFTPNLEGTYTFTFKATGENGHEVSIEVDVKVLNVGIRVGDYFLPITQDEVNRVGKPQNTVSIYTELVGIGEYGVVVIVDAHGYIQLVRDTYETQFDLTHPIKVGPASTIRSIINTTGWKPANILNGITGPQGTEGGIPLGGFAIYFAFGGTGHPSRMIGLTHFREIGLKIEVVNLEIPNFDPNLSTSDPVFSGVEDIELTVADKDTFDPMAGVSAKDFDGSELTVSIHSNVVDFDSVVDLAATAHTHANYKNGWYWIIYEATGANGYTRHVIRRVTVR